jgi:hypothetical protein
MKKFVVWNRVLQAIIDWKQRGRGFIFSSKRHPHRMKTHLVLLSAKCRHPLTGTYVWSENMNHPWLFTWTTFVEMVISITILWFIYELLKSVSKPTKDFQGPSVGRVNIDTEPDFAIARGCTSILDPIQTSESMNWGVRNWSLVRLRILERKTCTESSSYLWRFNYFSSLYVNCLVKVNVWKIENKTSSSSAD